MTARPALAPHRAPRPRPFWRHPLFAPINNPEAWSRFTSVLNPLWSLTEVRARVVRLVDETPGVRSLWLEPSRRFRGFRPGQHAMLELEIDGARHARCFSFSHAPRADGLLRLTIKRKDEGPVSTAAHRLATGDVVRLGQAQGGFAPKDSGSALLFLGAGSGITPILALAESLANAGSARDVVVLHSDRSPTDTIFAQELQALAARWPAPSGTDDATMARATRLRLLLHTTSDQGRLDAPAIARLVPDWQSRETLLCGPDGFMRNVEAMYAAAGRSDQLQCESFGRRAAPIDADAAEHAVMHGGGAESTPEQVFTARAGQSLLDAAEAAGLQPRFGCRRGICRTCQCLKRNGTVLNLLTGQRSGPGEELIQLCISTPQSALELAL